MCGICGILHVCGCEHMIEDELSKSLKNLRHRGYDGSGIAINIPYDDSLSRRRIVDTKHFLKQFNVDKLVGKQHNTNGNRHNKHNNHNNSKKCNCKLHRIAGLAHTRYKTAGNSSLKNTQPVFNKDMTMSLVHNGQIEVYSSVYQEPGQSREQIFDSKYILEVFERSFNQTDSIFRSIKVIHDTVVGAYACVIMIKDLGIVAFRDPQGIRPLVFGTENNNMDLELFNDVKNVKTAIFTSESIVIDKLQYKFIRDVKPGESIFVDLKGNVRYGNYSIPVHSKNQINYTPCLFEYIYLADENSVIDGIKVKRAREIMGEVMVPRLNRYFGSIEVIAPVPNTPVNATKCLSKLLKVKYVDLLYLPSIRQLQKSNCGNRDDENDEMDVMDVIKTCRTFILPTQNKRKLAVEDKFRINVDTILDCQDKIIALVDDSIVRGTTMSVIVKMIRELVQPKKLIIVSLAPPIKYENFYGIDISARSTLVAHERTSKEIAQELGADEVIYGDLDTIIKALRKEAHKNKVYVDGYENSVFEIT